MHIWDPVRFGLYVPMKQSCQQASFLCSPLQRHFLPLDSCHCSCQLLLREINSPNITHSLSPWSRGPTGKLGGHSFFFSDKYLPFVTLFSGLWTLLAWKRNHLKNLHMKRGQENITIHPPEAISSYYSTKAEKNLCWVEISLSHRILKSWYQGCQQCDNKCSPKSDCFLKCIFKDHL